MRRLWLIPLMTIVVLIPLAAVLAATGDDRFDAVVQSIEKEYHVHATEIPFMGLASLVANRASKGGVSGLHVAEFEHFSATVDGNELTGMVEKKLGSDWQRMIRERGKKGTELTLIYIHPEGARMGIFVFALDGHELEVVQASIDPDSLSRTIAQYDHEDDKTMTDKDVSE